jgi:outer membrane receptor protein involved in Fe transport
MLIIYSSAFTQKDYCKISGVVTELETNEALPFATVSLHQIIDSSLLFGDICNGKGVYEIDNIPKGNYLLSASYMGYNTFYKEVNISNRKQVFDIQMEKKSFNINEVEVTAEADLVQESSEKTTVNVSKITTTTGGNALDVLQNLPAVDIDVDGQVRYRGSNRVTILINGTRSQLVKTLDQIPADQIKKVEIINNPSAKYEADGMSGIINIVLKSGSKLTSNGSMMLFAGLPQTFGGNVGYSNFSKKTSYFINAGYKNKTQFQTKEHTRLNFEDLQANDYYQYDRQDQTLNDIMLNAGFDYQINGKQKIGLGFVGTANYDPATRSINYQTWSKLGELVYNSIRDIDILLENYVVEGNLDYEYNINDQNKLSIKANYNQLDQSQVMKFSMYLVDSPDKIDYFNTYSDQYNNTGQADINYSLNITDSMNLEFGYRFSYEDLINDFSAKNYISDQNIWQEDTALSNRFHYLQKINAGYVNLEAKLRFVQIQAGLRAEHTTTNQFVKPSESYLDLFPSVSISKNINEGYNAFLSYNRRINRPVLKMINPYTNEYADILNMHVGNPDLKPEYVNSIETGARYNKKNTSVKASVYYRYIDQAISRVKSATNDSALLVTFMNLDYAQLFGAEVLLTIKPVKWWQINANANFFYTTLNGVYGPNVIDKSSNGWTGNLLNKITLPAKFQLQFNFYYKSELPDVLGTYMERYYADMAISRKVLNDKGKVVFKISDVFNTYRYGLDLVGVDENGYKYSQKNRRKNESQYFILSFTYNFKGKDKKKSEKYFLEGFGK